MFARSRAAALATAVAMFLAGCLAPATEQELAASAGAPTDAALAVHSGFAGAPLPDLREALRNATAPVARLSSVGEEGPEPTMGVTSSGALFFVAGEKTMRSKDGGLTWQEVSLTVTTPALPPRGGVLTVPPTLDPMLWVDPDTDRVFVDHLYVGCSYLSWSDDEGKTWTTNPAACGLPGNDHQKIATGKNVGMRPQSPLYPNVVYYAYNGLTLGARVSASFDGGLTWTQNAQATPPTCVGGLHGHITAAPDGTLYLPKRECDGPIVAVSKDSGATWDHQQIGKDVGTTLCQKNPEVAADSANNAYFVWAALDDQLYLSRSMDGGTSWDEKSIRVTPPHMGTSTFPVVQAGDPGRVAIAYYGTEALPETKEGRDGEDKKGPDTVPEDARWHLWLTYSLNALDPNPTFVTIRVTPEDDPMQIGPISTNSSGCPNPPGSRNLLDFMDMVVDAEGRVFVAYADGCVDECVAKGADATMEDSRSRLGMVAIVEQGPSLFEAVGELGAYMVGGHEH